MRDDQVERTRGHPKPGADREPTGGKKGGTMLVYVVLFQAANAAPAFLIKLK